MRVLARKLASPFGHPTQVSRQVELASTCDYLPVRLARALYLALTNRAGGLYGRILTEVVSTDRTQWGLYTRPRSRFSNTDRLSSVNKMFITWQKHEQFNSFNLINWFVLTDILLASGDEPNLIFPKFARSLYFFFSSTFWHLRK